MDIIAHGLWTNAIYKGFEKRKRKVSEIVQVLFWSDFPDFLSFGLIFVLNLMQRSLAWHGEEYYISHLPPWFYYLHDVVYSLPIFFAVFFLIRIFARKYYWPLGGWFIHIAIDIFTHKTFFAPRFLWPFYPNVHLELISWANPVFMIVNYTTLVIVYGFVYIKRKR